MRSHPAKPWRRALMPRQPYSEAVPSTGGRLHPPLPEEEGLGEKVELSLQERRRGRKFSTVGRLHPLVPEGREAW